MLEPKKVKFRKVHRGNRRGMSMRGNFVNFGSYGLKALEPGWVTARQIESSRIICCPLSTSTVDATRLQLHDKRSVTGWRLLWCKVCHMRTLSRRWSCECHVPWHTCELHRNDPLVHVAPERGRVRKKLGNNSILNAGLADKPPPLGFQVIA